MYETFKASVLGKVIGDGQCVALVRQYLADIYPGVSEFSILPQVASAYQLANQASKYLTWVENNHSDANQLPSQGNIMVFGPTPESGYTDTFKNPDGHTGICDSATSSGYALLSQNSPATGDPANVYSVNWKYRPCLGWYTIGSTPTPEPTPAPTPSVQTITLPATTGPWHLYAPGFAGNKAHVIGVIEPEALHESLTYNIIASLGNGVYRIKSSDFGIGDLYTNGSDVKIS